MPWAFFRLGGINGKLSRNGGLLNMDIIVRMQQLVGLSLFCRKVAGIGSYPSLELACSLVDDEIVCCKEGHSEKHGISSKIYDEE